MRVGEVLRVKGSTIVSISPLATLQDAAASLLEHHIGALVVLDQQEVLVGILSERDIVSAVARNGADALGAHVGDAMSFDVVTCAPEESVEQLMVLMTEHRIRHLPVIDRSILIGVISIGDVVKHRISEVTDESQVLADYMGLGR